MKTAPAAPPTIADEAARIVARRAHLATGIAPDAPVIGLALSGGGIRSATFALGVMQALNDVPMPGATPIDPTVDVPGEEPRLANLLARFDYLSTVSGGGYVGSFFCSLFVPGRLEAKDTTTLGAGVDSLPE